FAIGRKKNKYAWMDAGGGGAAADTSNRFKAPPSSFAEKRNNAEGSGSGTNTPAGGGGVGKVEGAGGSPAAAGGTGGGEGMARGGSAQAAPTKALEWGDWREEAEAGIQVRDWMHVLERDGKQKLALQRLFTRLGVRETGGVLAGSGVGTTAAVTAA
ncbi:hypothetical protein LTR53_018456, partial [Teratosphaeriaceae sp. CCFEE 6253]